MIRTVLFIWKWALWLFVAISLLVLVMVGGAMALLADVSHWRWAIAAEEAVRRWVLELEEALGL